MESFQIIVAGSMKKFAVTHEEKGRYTILSVIGEGGLGKVIAAYDNHIGREIAIKELLPLPDNVDVKRTGVSSNQALEERFLREARITGQLEHPSIVPVYEIGEKEDGKYYYSMKIVRGKTFHQAIEEAKTLDESLKLLPHFRDLCQAIAYAHSKNIIHRDIKSENVMIGEFGETVVLDWGLAKVEGEADEAAHKLQQGMELLTQDSDSHKTVAGSSVGTPSYMSPEQARGEIDNIDKQSDVYALGAVLYEILSGKPPFNGLTTRDIIHNVISKNLKPLQSIDNPPPKELAAIAEKALSKEKSKRYTGASELVSEIEAYMSGQKVSVYEYTSLELFTRFAAKNKLLVLLTFMLFSVITFSFIFSYNMFIQEKDARRDADIQKNKAIANKLRANYHFAQSLLKRGEELLAKNRLLEAKIYAAASLMYNPVNTGSPYYNNSFEDTFNESVHFKALATSTLYLADLLPAIRLRKTFRKKEVFSAAMFSPDDRLIAAPNHDHNIYLWDVKRLKQVEVLTGHTKRVWSVQFLKDGTHLISAGDDGKIIIWNIHTGKAVQKIAGHRNRIRKIDLSPDDRLIASASWDKTVKIWNTDSGRLIKTLKGHTSRVLTVTFSPDGRYLASAGTDKTIRLWDVKSFRLVKVFKGHVESIRDVIFTKDVKNIISVAGDKTRRTWNIASGKQLKSVYGKEDNIYSISFSPDGNWLATASFEKIIKIWNTRLHESVLAHTAHSGQVMSVNFSHNGMSLVTAGMDKCVKVWDISFETEIETYRGPKSRIWKVDVSPDGKYIAAGNIRSQIFLWKRKDGLNPTILKGHADMVFDTLFSHNNKYLATASFDSVSLFDVSKKKELFRKRIHTGRVWAVDFSPDNTELVSAGGDGNIVFYSVPDGKVMRTRTPHNSSVYAVAYSPDGKKLATASKDKTVKISDISTGNIEQTLRHKDWVTGISFKKDNRFIYSCGKDKNAYLWNIETGKIKKVYQGHTGWVNQVKQSVDGKYIITSSDDRTVRIWDAETQKPLQIIPTREGVGIDFFSNNRFFAVGDWYEVKVYPFNPALFSQNAQTLLSISQKEAGMVLDGFLLKHVE